MAAPVEVVECQTDNRSPSASPTKWWAGRRRR